MLLVRVLDENAKIINLAFNDDEVIKPKAKFVHSLESELLNNSGQQMLIVRLPIPTGDQVIGTIEVIEKLESLEGNIRALVYVLVFSSIGAIILSLISGLFLSKLILRPINRMIKTMDEIEGSLTFKQIPLKQGQQDELYKMVETLIE
jgi:two-component system sensor histidine kinase ArlS